MVDPLEAPPQSQFFPYRPPRIDEVMFQAQLPELVALESGEAAQEDGAAAAGAGPEKKKRRPAAPKGG